MSGWIAGDGPSKAWSSRSQRGVEATVARVATGLDLSVRLRPTGPRRRRPADVTTMLLAGIGFGLLGWAAWREPPLDARVLELLADLPGWIRAVSWVAYSGAAIAALGLLVAAMLRGGVLRDVIVALVIVAFLNSVASRLVAGTWPTILPELFEPGNRLGYPTLRTTAVATVTMVLAPHLAQPFRGFGRWMIAAVVVSPLLLGFTTVTNLLGALTLASLSVGLVRVIFGSPEGLPPVGRLGDALARLGVPTTELAYVDDQPGTFGLATARSADGRRLTIKVYGRDAADRERVERAWRALWYRSSGPRVVAGRSSRSSTKPWPRWWPNARASGSPMSSPGVRRRAVMSSWW